MPGAQDVLDQPGPSAPQATKGSDQPSNDRPAQQAPTAQPAEQIVSLFDGLRFPASAAARVSNNVAGSLSQTTFLGNVPQNETERFAPGGQNTPSRGDSHRKFSSAASCVSRGNGESDKQPCSSEPKPRSDRISRTRSSGDAEGAELAGTGAITCFGSCGHDGGIGAKRLPSATPPQLDDADPCQRPRNLMRATIPARSKPRPRWPSRLKRLRQTRWLRLPGRRPTPSPMLDQSRLLHRRRLFHLRCLLRQNRNLRCPWGRWLQLTPRRPSIPWRSLPMSEFNLSPPQEKMTLVETVETRQNQKLHPMATGQRRRNLPLQARR